MSRYADFRRQIVNQLPNNHTMLLPPDNLFTLSDCYFRSGPHVRVSMKNMSDEKENSLTLGKVEEYQKECFFCFSHELDYMDLFINSDVDFNNFNNSYQYPERPHLYTTIAHEISHILKLQHNRLKTSLTYYNFNEQCKGKICDINLRDIVHFLKIYNPTIAITGGIL